MLKLERIYMKKTYFVAAAVALAVFFAGCDGFLALPEADNEEGLKISFRTPDGSITTDGSRALTTPIAAAGADYFEVVFDNGSRKVRTSWGNGATGRIIPGNGNYNNSAIGGSATVWDVDNATTKTSVFGKAYIFAGRNGTLLGVGVLVEVNNDGGVGDENPVLASRIDTYIDIAKATEVVFEITALNTDVGGLRNPDPVTGEPRAPNPGLSTFQIEVAPSNPFSGQVVASLLLDKSQDPPLTAPVFVINPTTWNDPGTPLDPSDDTAVPIDAQFDITDTKGKSFGHADYDDIRSAIIVKAAGTPRVACSGFLWEAGGSPFAKVEADFTNVTTGSALNVPIQLEVVPGDKAGLSRLSIDIPVVMYDGLRADNGADPYNWYIRGGLNNTSADQGAMFSDGDGSLGGAVLIGVGEYNKNAAGLIIGFKPIK